MSDLLTEHLLLSAYWCRYLANNEDPNEKLGREDLEAMAGEAALMALLRRDPSAAVPLTDDEQKALQLRADSAISFANGNSQTGMGQLKFARFAALDALPIIPPPEVNFDPEPIEPGDEPFTSVLNYEEGPGGGWVVTGRNHDKLGLTTTWQTPINTSGGWKRAQELAWRYLINLWAHSAG